MLKNELVFSCLPGLNLESLKKMVLCFRFDIQDYTVSKTRLLKAEFMNKNDSNKWAYTAVEQTRCGYYEIHLN